MGIRELQAKMAELNAEIEREGRSGIIAEWMPIFEKHPELLSVRWTQYTPYFNDGEECVFDKHANGYTVKDAEGEEHEIEEYGDEEDPIDMTAIYASIREFPDIDADIYKAAFGDHAEVRLDRDGTVTVEAYEHD